MHSFGRGEILGLVISDIGFGRSPIRPIGRSLYSNTGYARRVRSKASRSVFLQELLDDALDVAIVAFPKVVVPYSPFHVDEVLSWPILVAERLPDPLLAVNGDRKSNNQISHGILHVHRFVLERKLRRVHTDHYKTGIVIFFCPIPQERQRSNGVDAGVSPEIDHHHLSTKRLAT